MKKLWQAAVVLIITAALAGCSPPASHPDGISSSPVKAEADHEGAQAQKSAQVKTEVGDEASETAGSSDAQPGTEEAAADNEQASFKLIITRNFGSEVIEELDIAVRPETSLIELMQQDLQVSTGFGGGFIKGINNYESGTFSGQRWDWFFYVNGIGSPVGAGQVKPRPGDMVWWDYHAWSSGPGQSAVIGCFPGPLNSTSTARVQVRVLTDASSTDCGEQVRQALAARGVNIADMADIAQHSDWLEKKSGPVLVIGEWDNLKESAFLKKWNDSFQKNGSGIHFEDGLLQLLGTNGQSQRTVTGSAGVIVARGSGLGDTAPLWLIAGTDQKGLQMAVEILCAQPEKLRWKYGLAVLPQEIVALPVITAP